METTVACIPEFPVYILPESSFRKSEATNESVVMNLNVALLQILPMATVEDNLQKGIACCRQAKVQGADIALFPEMWSIGYRIHNRFPEEWIKKALPQDSKFTAAFGTLAGELEMAIGITFLEASPVGPKNSLLLFDRHGNRALSYSKVHTCDFDVERHLTPGDDFYVTELDTAAGMVKTGAMICYDREFPESARILMLKGAELILVPNACPMEINRLSQLRTRAFENMVAIATCNYPAGQPDCNGHSSAFDGIVYRPDTAGSRDTLVIEAGEAEGIYMAAFPIDELRAYRKTEIHGNAYRHPEKYRSLTAQRIQEPFIRPDYRK